jgi:LysM repeat protein
MKSNVALVGMAAVVLAACGTNGNTSTQTTLGLTATNYVTITPTPTTVLAPTSSVGNPGTIHPEEGQYTLTAEDIYASRVAAKFKVKLEDLLSINNVTLDSNGFAVGWPPAGTVIRIPPGWTEPGAPTDTTPSNGTTATIPTTTTLPGGKCPTGEYTIVAGDYEGKVATKLDTTVEALRAVNANTPGYSSFYPGLKIKTPPKATC